MTVELPERTDPRAFLGVGLSFPVKAAGVDIAMVGFDEDIRQAISLILFTDHGERLMRPTFGAGLNQFIFKPVNTTTMALLKQRVEESLTTWEPRIDLTDVSVRADYDQPGSVNIGIEYVVRATNTFYNLVFPFYLREGAA